MRTIGIWISGILASGIVGGILGSVLGSADQDTPYGIFGFVAGALAFTCLRLWLADRR